MRSKGVEKSQLVRLFVVLEQGLVMQELDDLIVKSNNEAAFGRPNNFKRRLFESFGQIRQSGVRRHSDNNIAHISNL